MHAHAEPTHPPLLPHAQRAILEANKTVWQPSAKTLSTNRAAKLNAVAHDYVEHCRNLYCMNKRIENAYTPTERRKNPEDPIYFPAYQKRNGNLYKSGVHQSLLTWIPG